MASSERPIAVVFALFANFGIAVAKFFAFAFTGSGAMLAEGIHSVADTSNQGLLLLGHHRARRPADEMHPFGYGQERYFWAFLVAVMLFAVGALFSLWQGFERIRHPHEIESLGWAIGVLTVAIGLESVALAKAVQEANREREGSWWHYIRTTKKPENAVVLLEDAAAQAGLLVALGGVLLAHFTGEARWDAAGSIGIGLVLAFVAIVLAIEMRSLLIGESADEDEVEVIREVLAGHPEIARVVELRTMHMGPSKILVAAHVEIDDDQPAAEVVRILDETERRLADRLERKVETYFEPQ